MLEREFGLLVSRQTRVTRIVTLTLGSIILLVALIAWPSYASMYGVGLAATIVALAVLLLRPGWANMTMAFLVVPVVAGASLGALLRFSDLVQPIISATRLQFAG